MEDHGKSIFVLKSRLILRDIKRYIGISTSCTYEIMEVLRVPEMSMERWTTEYFVIVLTF